MKGKIMVLTVILMILYVPIFYFAFSMPADTAWNQQVGSHVTMAYDQADFQRMLDQINIVWKEMNDTFGTERLDTIHGTWWPTELTYDNSLAAQRDYFQSITSRLRDMIDEQNSILAGNQTIMIPYNTWYQQALEGFRNEAKREGGLTWAFAGAWYKTYAPAVYYYLFSFVLVEVILCIIAFAVFLGIVLEL